MKLSASKLWDTIVYAFLIIILLVLIIPYFYSDFSLTFHSMQVYWKQNGENYSEPNSSKLCSVKDSNTHKLNFETIKPADSLRLDPVTHGSIVNTIYIHNIKVMQDNGHSTNWENINLSSTINCNNCKITTNSDILTIDVTGTDPWFELPLPLNKSYNKVEIEFNVASIRPPFFYWLRAFFKSNHISIKWISCDHPI